MKRIGIQFDIEPLAWSIDSKGNDYATGLGGFLNYVVQLRRTETQDVSHLMATIAWNSAPMKERTVHFYDVLIGNRVIASDIEHARMFVEGHYERLIARAARLTIAEDEE